MPRFFSVAILLSCLVAWPPARAMSEEPADVAGDVRVMSFNIRFGSARDGENRWDLRKDFVVETVQAFRPDLLGTQETLGYQRDHLAANLPGYDNLGVGRDDGGDKGEMMALFYRTERFEKLDGGHFWLSEKPEIVGSKSWDSSLPRMVTWVKLRDLDRQSARPILFLNTHFDHIGQTARTESAKLVRVRAAQLGEGCEVIVTGDFNAGEASAPYQALFAAVGDEPSLLVDSLRVFQPEAAADEGTFSGFRADSVSGARIDWIAVSRGWTVVRAGIDRTSREGKTPSDHFPVYAVLRAETQAADNE